MRDCVRVVVRIGGHVCLCVCVCAHAHLCLDACNIMVTQAKY